MIDHNVSEPVSSCVLRELSKHFQPVNVLLCMAGITFLLHIIIHNLFGEKGVHIHQKEAGLIC